MQTETLQTKVEGEREREREREGERDTLATLYTVESL